MCTFRPAPVWSSQYLSRDGNWAPNSQSWNWIQTHWSTQPCICDQNLSNPKWGKKGTPTIPSPALLVSFMSNGVEDCGCQTVEGEAGSNTAAHCPVFSASSKLHVSFGGMEIQPPRSFPHLSGNVPEHRHLVEVSLSWRFCQWRQEGFHSSSLHWQCAWGHFQCAPKCRSPLEEALRWQPCWQR